MPIPDYQMIMQPLLEFASKKNECKMSEAVDHLSQVFALSEEDSAQLLPSGARGLFYDRVHWALVYLKHAGMLQSTRHGWFKITNRGKSALAQKPNRIDTKYLLQFPGFANYLSKSRSPPKKSDSPR